MEGLRKTAGEGEPQGGFSVRLFFKEILGGAAPVDNYQRFGGAFANKDHQHISLNGGDITRRGVLMGG